MTSNLIPKVKKATPFKKKSYSKTGKLSKKALTFLEIIKKEFAFEPVKEFIHLYANEKEVYEQLYYKMSDETRRASMTVAEKEDFWMMHKEFKDSIKYFVKYSYPTLRSTQVKGSFGPAPVFNINLGAPERTMKSANKAIDVTPEEE